MLEDQGRGVYTGAIGYIKPNRRAQFSVAIRTLVVDKLADKVTYGVGGGIVWDSDPHEEWQETLDKAAVLKDAYPPFRLLETMLYQPGVGVRLQDYHLDRLAHFARHFGFEFQRELVLDNITAFESAQPQRMRLLLGPSGEPEIQATACPEVDSVVQLKLAAAPLDCMNPFLFHKQHIAWFMTLPVSGRMIAMMSCYGMNGMRSPKRPFITFTLKLMAGFLRLHPIVACLPEYTAA